MSQFKFRSWTHKLHPMYDPITDNSLFKIWNHWLNPLGNWHEPLPFPEIRRRQADAHWLNNAIYWNIRNFGHNFTHFWIGIVPVGKRYEWISPGENNWFRTYRGNWSYWTKPKYGISLPYYKRKGILFGTKYEWALGWKSDGCFGINFRR